MDTQPAGQNWDAFEAHVTAHKMAVARLTRLEDQLIAIIREHQGPPDPGLAARYSAAIDEARALAMATSHALFPPGDGAAPTPVLAPRAPAVPR